MSSGSSNSSSSTSIGTFPLVAAIVGGVATCCVLAMTIYLLIQRRRRRRDEEKFVSEDMRYDVEKFRNISPPPAVYHNNGRSLISAPQDFQVLERPTITVIPTLKISSAPSNSPPPKKPKQRPTITVVTDIPTVSAIMTPQMITPKTPKTPKWKLKRVPVPRFSSLVPTPVAITRSRSWLRSPRQFRKSFDRKREAKGLPSSVRPPVPAAHIPPPSLLDVPTLSYTPSPPPLLPFDASRS